MLPELIAAAAVSFGSVSVTNHAGHVLSGELTSVTNGNFTVSGKTYPLTILPPSEQKRLREITGQDVRSAKERQQDKRVNLELRRIEARLAAGEITEEQAAALRSDVIESAKVVKSKCN